MAETVRLLRKDTGEVKEFPADKAAQLVRDYPDKVTYAQPEEPGGFEYFTSPQFLQRDLPKGAAQAIGGTALALMKRHPVGAVASALLPILGGAMGGELYDQYRRWALGDDSGVARSMGEVPGEVGGELLEGAVGEVGGAAIGKGLGAARGVMRNAGVGVSSRLLEKPAAHIARNIDRPAEVAARLENTRPAWASRGGVETAADVAAARPAAVAESITQSYRRLKQKAMQDYVETLAEAGIEENMPVDPQDALAIFYTMQESLSKFFNILPDGTIDLKSMGGGGISPAEASKITDILDEFYRLATSRSLTAGDLIRMRGKIDYLVTFSDDAFAKGTPASAAMKQIRARVNKTLHDMFPEMENLDASYSELMDAIEMGRDYFGSPDKALNTVEALTTRNRNWVGADNAISMLNKYMPGLKDAVDDDIAALAMTRGHDLGARGNASQFLHTLGMAGVPLAAYYRDPKLGGSMAALLALTDPRLSGKVLRGAGRVGQAIDAAGNVLAPLPGETGAGGLGGFLGRTAMHSVANSQAPVAAGMYPPMTDERRRKANQIAVLPEYPAPVGGM